jgi:hypothetical protein
MKRERESEREGVSLRVTRVSSSKPNVTPDVDHSDRCILLHEEWQQLIDRRVRGGHRCAMGYAVVFSHSPVMTPHDSAASKVRNIGQCDTLLTAQQHSNMERKAR